MIFAFLKHFIPHPVTDMYTTRSKVLVLAEVRKITCNRVKLKLQSNCFEVEKSARAQRRFVRHLKGYIVCKRSLTSYALKRSIKVFLPYFYISVASPRLKLLYAASPKQCQLS